MGRRAATLAVASALAACGAPMDEVADAEAFETALEDTRGDSRSDVAALQDARGDSRSDVAALQDARGDSRSDVAALQDARGDSRSDVAALPDARGDVLDAGVDAGVDAGPEAGLDAGAARCPAEMVLVAGRVCVDRWEASLEALDLDGGAAAWSPYLNPGTRRVRAVSRPGVVPQGYITGEQSQAACRNGGKRLCVLDEWLAACRGPAMLTYPYGMTYAARRCNEGRAVHPVVQFFGTSTGVFTFENMNHPGINMQPDTVARTGAFAGCVSPWGAFDMVGNLHEWIADPNGTFKGGFYVDAVRNGPGCLYTTTAHAFSYRDYSTGFRCCADPSRAP